MPDSLKITRLILDNLHDRKGVGDELDLVKYDDPDLYLEIVHELSNIVEDNLD